eukprot:TRINITY_DN119_c0_g1_i13.p1 TRINITY_DN119_c0_g1~~TRINITY_DN119_c0_g1_i13.p1  ORF type:complete len:354 (+),score=97.75 TRINITY_DN119_c0_g1_i13:77-1063(+)
MYTDDAQAFADSQMNFGGMDSNDEKEQKNNLIVNYIPVYMSQDDLHKLFAPYGNIISCKLIVDKNTGMSLGYGFIKFSDESEAEKAIQHLNGHHIGGKSLKVSAARPPNGKLNERTTVYIAGFPTTWTKAELEALVRPFGKLMESKILNDQQGKSRGVGFVRFETNGQAASAIHGLNGTLPAGGTKTLQAKLAQYPISSGKRVMQQRVQMQMGALFGVNPLGQSILCVFFPPFIHTFCLFLYIRDLIYFDFCFCVSSFFFRSRRFYVSLQFGVFCRCFRLFEHFCFDVYLVVFDACADKLGFGKTVCFFSLGSVNCDLSSFVACLLFS